MYKCGGERGSVVGSLYYLRCDRKEVLMRFGGECDNDGDINGGGGNNAIMIVMLMATMMTIVVVLVMTSSGSDYNHHH